MSDYELAQMLNITVPEAQQFIQRCDRFDTFMESLYEQEAVDRYQQGLDDLIESADWDLDFDS